MKICLIGDSWTGYPPHSQHIVKSMLEKLGHLVWDTSHAGASNYGQLKKMRWEVLENHKPDLIIWFHSEPARDYTEFVSLLYSFDQEKATHFSDLSKTNLVDDLHYINTQNYKLAQEFYDVFQIPFVIIGACAPLSPTINDFSFYKYKLDSWNKQISKFSEMPVNCYTHHLVEMLSHNPDYKSQQSLKELELTDKLEIFMRTNTDLYPDGAHPHISYYPWLIDTIFNNLEKK